MLAHNKNPHDIIPKKNARLYPVCVRKKAPEMLIKIPITDSTIATIENAFTVFCLNIIMKLQLVNSCRLKLTPLCSAKLKINYLYNPYYVVAALIIFSLAI